MAKKKNKVGRLPIISPYTDAPVILSVGPEHKAYYVPKHLLLRDSGRIASIDQYSSSIDLPDVDESTGHVLAHYLYTNTYQTPHSVEISPDEVFIEFKKACAVYQLAKNYEISGLRQLAIDKIEQSGNEMTIHNVLEAIDGDLSEIAGDTDWFQDYLIRKFSKAFQEDFTIFATDGFFDGIKNAQLCKLAVKCAVELYNNKISCLLHPEHGDPVAVKEEIPPYAEEPIPDDEEPIPDVEEPIPVVEEPIPVVEEPIPVVEEPILDVDIASPPQEFPPAPAEDDWGFLPAIGTSKKKKKKKAIFAVEEPPPAVEEPSLRPVSPPASAEDEWGSLLAVGTSKKNKKNRENLTVEEPPPDVKEPSLPAESPPPEITPAPAEDVWGFSKKKKKGKKVPNIQPDFEVQDFDDWGNNGTTAHFTAVETSAATAEPEPAKDQMENENFSDFALDLRNYFKAEGAVCQNQAEHLLERRMWKNCTLCRGLLAQIAVDIARTVVVDRQG